MNTQKDNNRYDSMNQPLIMVVDDEDAVRLPIRFSLENFGFRVVEAESGEEALTIYADQRPDLILLDVLMAGIDGFETCSSIRQHTGGEHVPIIMMTSLEDEETIISAFDSGATDFVAKPLNLLILGYRVRYWLRSSLALIQLQTSEQHLAKAQQIAMLGHWEWDLQSNDIEVTCHSPEAFGLKKSLTYTHLIQGIVEEDQENVQQSIDFACISKKPFSVNYRILDDQGVERTILNQGEFSDRTSSERCFAFGIVQDITAMKHAENRIRYLAFYDSLTGLANRALFKEHWLKISAMNERSLKRVAIIFIDLDHFKQINDTLGHPIGDQVLIQVAERLKATLRQSDVVSRSHVGPAGSIISRVGGDEFTILAVNFKSLEHIAKLAERIIETVSRPIELAGQKMNLSASVGISMFPEDSKDLDTLLKHADTAMYEAKSKGRNNYQFFRNSMNDAVQSRFQLQNKLHKAIKEEEFTLYYQPKYSNTDGRIKGVEALIRWIDPERGLIAPNDFLPFAEENNLIHIINDWVIRQACVQAEQWVRQGFFHESLMSINISGKNINFKKLVATINNCLRETGLSPHYLEVELTERVMMENTNEAKKALMSLKDLGVSIAIDDFGTGYSALSHLQIFPLTTLKIDKSFINNIGTTENGHALLLSIINIAKSLNLKVVAEGVETASQKSALGLMQCDELQGYLLSRPLPAEEVEKLLTQFTSGL